MSSPIITAFPNMSSYFSLSTAVAVVAISIFILYLWLLQLEKLDPREPPLARPKVPAIGHMIGLLWHQNNYFRIIYDRFPWPICTLKIFSTRMYIIASPELAAAAFRNSKEIDFDTIVKAASCNVVDFDQHGRDIVNYAPKNGDNCYMVELHHEMYNALSKGRPLLQTNARLLNCLARNLNLVGTASQSKQLFRWMRDFYTIASAEAFYGLNNPVAKDPSLVQSTWDFEGDLGMLALNFMPSITAPKGNAARKSLTAGFLNYYNSLLDKEANDFVKGRARAARKWGLTTEEICKAEATIISASVTNTVPNVFYAICYVFADPALTTNLREEVSKIFTRSTRNGVDTVVLDISMIESHCPLLVSCYSETLRLNKTGASIRTALSDVILNDQYLLKKGSLIQIATDLVQSDLKTWGPDAKYFNARRFMRKESLSKEEKKAQAQAWMPFGGGRNMCPGRHLAFTEITSFVAMMVYGFELCMSDGSVLEIPERGFQKLGVASRSPKNDVDVLISRRTEFEGVTWLFDSGKS